MEALGLPADWAGLNADYDGERVGKEIAGMSPTDFFKMTAELYRCGFILGLPPPKARIF